MKAVSFQLGALPNRDNCVMLVTFDDGTQLQLYPNVEQTKQLAEDFSIAYRILKYPKRIQSDEDCPECARPLYVNNPDMVLYSCPAQWEATCDHCQETHYIPYKGEE